MEEVVRTGSTYAPSVVVKVEMVERAEKHTVCDVGSAAFGDWIDVMGFGLPCGLIAVRPQASAVSRPEHYSLCRAEEATGVAEVQCSAVSVDRDRDGAAFALARANEGSRHG
jgi:hypothetical protein